MKHEEMNPHGPPGLAAAQEQTSALFGAIGGRDAAGPLPAGGGQPGLKGLSTPAEPYSPATNQKQPRLPGRGCFFYLVFLPPFSSGQPCPSGQ